MFFLVETESTLRCYSKHCRWFHPQNTLLYNDSKFNPVQERMTHQIAETLNSVLSPKGVAVVLEGQHMCMQMRGVEKQNSYATTSSMTGLFRKDSRTREEFLNIISMKKLS